MNCLRAKRKIRFINRKIPRPPKYAKEYSLWMKTDTMIIAWIKNSMSNNIKTFFTYVKSAHALWRSLKTKYGQINGLLIFQLKKNLFNLKQGDEDLTSYYSRVQMSLDELKDVQSLPETIEEVREHVETFLYQDNLIIFLNGLNN